jgi:hypothetical protein
MTSPVLESPLLIFYSIFVDHLWWKEGGGGITDTHRRTAHSLGPTHRCVRWLRRGSGPHTERRIPYPPPPLLAPPILEGANPPPSPPRGIEHRGGIDETAEILRSVEAEIAEVLSHEVRGLSKTLVYNKKHGTVALLIPCERSEHEGGWR